MSRTKRRKRGKVRSWLFYEYDYVWYGEALIYKKTPLTGQELKVQLAKFHSDKGGRWLSNAPKHFRQAIEAVKRAKDKHEINRINKQGDYDNYNFNPRRSDINWLWW